MKKFILLSIAILTFNMVSIAQTQTPEQRAKAQTEKMTTELNLSTSQVASVYEVNAKCYLHGRCEETGHSTK